MSDQNSTVASLRVDKPGKSRFAPIVRPTPHAAAGSTSLTTDSEKDKTTITRSRPANTTEIKTSVLPTQTGEFERYDEFGFRRAQSNDFVHPSPPPTPITQETGAASTTGSLGRTIEAIAASRRARQTSSAPIVEEVKITPSEGKKITMAHFIRDTGEGIPMIQASSNGKKSKRSPPSTLMTTPVRRATGPLSTMVVPQVRVVDGQIVLDEHGAATTTTTISSENRESRLMEVVNESDGRHLTSHAFVKTIGNNRWNRQDTDRFYEALSVCGTDFSLISQIFFPNRTREQVKGKFRVEEKKFPDKVAHYLRQKRPMDAIK